MGTFPTLPTGISPAQFRLDFSEFSNTVLYPDSAINYWFNIANVKLNATVSGSRWGRLLIVGMELFVAHNLVLEAIAQRGASAAGIPGIAKGAIASSSAGDVSVNYDTQATMEEKAGHWNYTIYGQRFIREARMTGAGPVQIGTGTSDGNTSLSDGNGGWSGPPMLPGQLG